MSSMHGLNPKGIDSQPIGEKERKMWLKNITGVSDGSYRSLNGAADENVFIGKATKAGFCLFFKAWRDMPYDAVLDYEGILFRVEVKGASQDKGGNTQFNVTRGGRSGQQTKHY